MNNKYLPILMNDTKFNRDRLYKFLSLMNKDYPVSLDNKVNLKSYVEKVFSLGNILVILEHDMIIACLIFYSNNFESFEGVYPFLGVAKKYRKKGFAELLIKESFKIMKEKGMKKLYTFTHRDNVAAINFYIKMGFELESSRPANYSYNVSLIKENID